MGEEKREGLVARAERVIGAIALRVGGTVVAIGVLVWAAYKLADKMGDWTDETQDVPSHRRPRPFSRENGSA